MGAVYVNSVSFRNEGSPNPVKPSIADCYGLFTTVVPRSIRSMLLFRLLFSAFSSASLWALFSVKRAGISRSTLNLRGLGAVAREDEAIARWPDGNPGPVPIRGETKWG
jgi:hypothetical protein